MALAADPVAGLSLSPLSFAAGTSRLACGFAQGFSARRGLALLTLQLFACYRPLARPELIASDRNILCRTEVLSHYLIASHTPLQSR